MTSPLRFEGVQFTYDSASTPCLEGVDLTLSSGWSGIVGANGSGKTTLLKLAIGDLAPSEGHVAVPPSTLMCAQRTDDPPEGFAAFMASWEPEAYEYRGRLEVEDDWADRWPTLSHGERKRAQIAMALTEAPGLLAIDEPTNHLDRRARRLVLEALRSYDGIGLLVSHDRELLDILCDRCVFLDPPAILVRRGGYSQGTADAERERESQRHVHEEVRRQRQRVKREVQRRREVVEQCAKKTSKRGLDPKDHDTKSKIDRARVTGKDGHGTRLMKMHQARLGRLEERERKARPSAQRKLGMRWGAKSAHRDRLWSLQATCLRASESHALRVPDLEVCPGDRLAITGRNGSGKSTLIRKLRGDLDESAFGVCYVPQEIQREESVRILQDVRRLDRESLGELMSFVSRLGSDPERVLETALPSPGELRKVLLALGRLAEPSLIIMDEPTNHLDLPSITCLEDALRDCQAALVLVSHDDVFLKALTDVRWHLIQDNDTYLLERSAGWE